MKKLLTATLLIPLLITLAAYASDLPPCPKGTYHNCFGTETFTNGSKYVGEYKDGKYHGNGTFTFVGGSSYVGEFKDNKKHGNGTFAYSNGSSYVGEFKNGKYNGKGTTTLADGTIFIGEFKDNEMNGQGTLWVEGRVISGIWADNKYLYESAESVDK